MPARQEPASPASASSKEGVSTSDPRVEAATRFVEDRWGHTDGAARDHAVDFLAALDAVPALSDDELRDRVAYAIQGALAPQEDEDLLAADVLDRAADAAIAAMRSGAPPQPSTDDSLASARGFTDGDAIRYVDRAIQALESGGAGTDWALRELRLLWGRLARERHLAEAPGLAVGEGERDGSVRITAAQRAGLARAQGLAEAIRDMPDGWIGAPGKVAGEIVGLLEPLRASLTAPHLDLTREEAGSLLADARAVLPALAGATKAREESLSAQAKLEAFLAGAPPEDGQ